MAQDEFFEDDIDDQKTVEYIKNALPQELKDKYTDDTLYYILDVINDYFTTSGVLDQEPDADGCIDIDNDALVSYIIKEAKKDKIAGRVMLQFVVGTDGSVSGVKVLRGVNPLLDAEAVRVISSSPNWTPGELNGEIVAVTYQFPVIFQLR